MDKGPPFSSLYLFTYLPEAMKLRFCQAARPNRRVIDSDHRWQSMRPTTWRIPTSVNYTPGLRAQNPANPRDNARCRAIYP
jgi:hypothetical protein